MINVRKTVFLTKSWPGPDNTFGYTGYQYDVAAGLYYAQARYYRPEIGRFISVDPLPGNITKPLTLNPYPYVLNNPMTYIDPLGLWKSEIHYDKTYEWALDAFKNSKYARIIAIGNKGVDDAWNPYSSPVNVFNSAQSTY